MSAFVEINNLTKSFGASPGLVYRGLQKVGLAAETPRVHAVNDVSLHIHRGETLGLVGESGCGKSTLGRVLAGIQDATSGSVTMEGKPVVDRSGGRRKLSTRIQTVFQDPFSSLDPRQKIGRILTEGPLEHGMIRSSEAAETAAHWLNIVGLDPAVASRLPHQFSGGQRQRIAIARALAMKPDLLICDEPVASLDVSIQAQIINLFLKLRRELDLTMLFISHDIGVVRHLADRVAVMYLGRVVETGPVADLFEAPAHPYSRALLASAPKLVIEDDDLEGFNPISGELPSPLSPPDGCHFNTRCPLAASICRERVPAMTPVSARHEAACHMIETGKVTS